MEVGAVLEEVATAVAVSLPQPDDVLVEWIRCALARDYPVGVSPGIDLAAVAHQAVADLDGARVRIFVPLLALRAAREMLDGT